MKHFILFLLVTFSTLNSFAQQLTAEEKKLYDQVMAYRKANNLPVIPVSASLTIVAQTHVKDLAEAKPDMGKCNAHSWSNKGKWTPCCYTDDHAKAAAMWAKPRELTTYKGNGYEIACGSNGCCSDFVMTAEYALDSWKGSPGHNGVILNKDPWKTSNWQAIGIGIYKGFAVVWFGEEEDK